MTDHDDLLKELGTALKVQPSTAFADGVRARVKKSQVRTMHMWWGLAAAATVGFAVMALWRPLAEVPVQVATSRPVETPVSAPAPAVPKPPTVPSAVERVTPKVRPSATVVRVAVSAGSEPRLEVITNQGAILRDVWAGIVARRVPLVERDATTASSQLDTAGIVVDPLVVAPLVVSEIGKEPTTGANPIIRRANATKETK